ncbi:uncharacterized protein [Amphiura filiformis]|uniref:uncharacterized protein n=1 Tax=Amphiura filiformis TaxID=82378 RepID=UPI003B2261C2
MGCGSSRIEEIARMYGEPSEFDTCSTMISSRDNRGEPDGSDVKSESEYKEQSSSSHKHPQEPSTIADKTSKLSSDKGRSTYLESSDAISTETSSSSNCPTSTSQNSNVVSQERQKQSRYYRNGLKFPPSPHPSKKTSTVLMTSSSPVAPEYDYSHVNFTPLVKGKHPLKSRKDSKAKRGEKKSVVGHGTSKK